MKYEYKVFDKGVWWVDRNKVQEQLNKLGEEGWKLVQVSHDMRTFFLIREK